MSEEYEKGYEDGFQAGRADVMIPIIIIGFIIITFSIMILGGILDCIPVSVLGLMIFFCGFFYVCS